MNYTLEIFLSKQQTKIKKLVGFLKKEVYDFSFLKDNIEIIKKIYDNMKPNWIKETNKTK